MIWIISGPTCSGKSTFLTSPATKKYTDISPSAPVFFPRHLTKQKIVPDFDYYYHYNTLRIAYYLFQENLLRSDNYTNFNEPLWLQLLSQKSGKKAIVLVARRSVIERRITTRTDSEPKKIRRQHNVRFLQEQNMAFLGYVNLETVYQEWCEELRRFQIPFTLIESREGLFLPLQPHQIKGLDST
ncbi:MAG: hypothetical protein WBB69_14015 [Anaerolineales bacterium]